MKFKVAIKPDSEDGGYNASCLALPGCHSQGDTIEEATANIQEAIEGCLEILNERAKPSSPVFGGQTLICEESSLLNSGRGKQAAHYSQIKV